MTTVVFDSSALTKLLLREADSDLAIDLWLAADGPVASQLAYPEVCAALGAAQRDRRLTAAEVSLALSRWTGLWAAVRTIDLTDDVSERAGALAVEYGLRGADAVHVAGYLSMGAPSALFASWDRRQREGAAAAGVLLAPASLP
ncbi:type II toxin-antitoxin system VapC family toxin [Lapillicoccus sp.]|uniref:type II toxin-antitoxin system VapC family toxin n=1 Tax=Lapillicoccus sp. TaxID=1909287 RepID=UPI0025F604AF|nr:type II toxin-antitoxin system VapC family toxin [Lapillicoccus sp.]